MKKNLNILFGVLVLSAAAYAFADNASVMSVTGKVEVNRNGEWIALGKDSVISEGEIISTGFKSEAVIKYHDSVMKLGPLTRVTLEKLASSDQKDNVAVYLNTGDIHSTVSRAQNKRIGYTVRNSVAVASVRGTQFSFDGMGNIICTEGGVSVNSASNFDPAMFGIMNPADGRAGATRQQAQEAENSVPAESTTTVFTSPNDIAPSGGVVVPAGQTVAFTNPVTAAPARPAAEGAKIQSSAGSGMATAADNEAVVMGGEIAGGASVNTEREPAASSGAGPVSGFVEVNVSFGQGTSGR